MEDLGTRDPPLRIAARADGSASSLPPAARVGAALILGALLAGMIVRGTAGQTPSTAPTLTLLSTEGRRTLPMTLIAGQEFIALDDLASIFQLAVQDDSLGAITVSYKGKTIVLTPDQALASVAGRLVSLPAPPSRSGRDRKSTRLNSSHRCISYAVFCLKKKKKTK